MSLWIVALPTYYRQKPPECFIFSLTAMTTNQKVVGSNPAGLTKQKTPGSLTKQGAGGFHSFWLTCGKVLCITEKNRATTDILPTRGNGVT